MPRIEYFVTLDLLIDGKPHKIMSPRFVVPGDDDRVDWAYVKNEIGKSLDAVKAELGRHETPESVLAFNTAEKPNVA